MADALRPMSTGELLDRTFNLYRNHFVLFAGIATLPPVFLLVVNLIQASMVASQAPGPRPRALAVGVVAAGGIGILIGYIAYMVGLAIAHAATIFAVSAVHLGRATTIGESYRRVKGRYGRVVNVILSVAIRALGPGMILLIVIIALMIPRVRGGAPSQAALLGIGMFFAIVGAGILAVVIYVRYSLAVPACVLEDIKAKAALKRSVALSHGSRGRIFVIYLLTVIINYIVMFLFLIPASIAERLVAPSMPFLAPVLSGLALFLAGALAGPIVTIALSLVYYDQRVRKEAFDIELMVAALDGTPPVAGAQSASVVAG